MIAINDLTRVIHAAERMDLWLYARGVHRLAAFKEECLQKDTYRCKFDYELIQWEAFYSWIMINITHYIDLLINWEILLVLRVKCGPSRRVHSGQTEPH